LTDFHSAQKSDGMQMTEAYASAVAVIVPIFALTDREPPQEPGQ
jgi:hypothetical protein